MIRFYKLSKISKNYPRASGGHEVSIPVNKYRKQKRVTWAKILDSFGKIEGFFRSAKEDIQFCTVRIVLLAEQRRQWRKGQGGSLQGRCQGQCEANAKASQGGMRFEIARWHRTHHHPAASLQWFGLSFLRRNTPTNHDTKRKRRTRHTTLCCFNLFRERWCILNANLPAWFIIIIVNDCCMQINHIQEWYYESFRRNRLVLSQETVLFVIVMGNTYHSMMGSIGILATKNCHRK